MNLDYFDNDPTGFSSTPQLENPFLGFTTKVENPFLGVNFQAVRIFPPASIP